ncbi:MAG: OmpA family protein [Bacteroidales bacterium]|nr:OmpA family protein [Bacteroidales bacterium]
MKRIKLITLLTFTLFVAGTTHAQREEHKRITDTISNIGEHNVGWIKSHILDNWTIDAQIGGQMYYGYEDREGPFFGRLGGLAEAHIGRWMFPMVGLRAGLGIGQSHGYITTDSYIAHRSEIINECGFGESEYTTEDTYVLDGHNMSGGLGGYYWTIDGEEKLLRQKWNYVFGGLDFMVNLSRMKRYSRVVLNKDWEHITYIGMNVRVGLSEKHPQMLFNNTNYAAEGHIGYIGMRRLNKNFFLHGKAQISLIEGLFDRERLPNIELMTPDIDITAMVGITYRFNLRNDEVRIADFKKRKIVSDEATDVPENLAFVQVEEVQMYQQIDSIILTRYDTVYDESIQQIILEKYELINSLKKSYFNLPATMPLLSILDKQYLPYEMVFFDLDKWDIRPEEEMKISKMAHLMKIFSDVKFTLYGAADSKTGTPPHNDTLSQHRVEVVFRRLVDQYGIPESQLKCEPMGGILKYEPYELNRATMIIMDHPAVRSAYYKMQAQGKAGGGVGEW